MHELPIEKQFEIETLIRKSQTLSLEESRKLIKDLIIRHAYMEKTIKDMLMDDFMNSGTLLIL
jgi:hypothetical protein